jgi:hypothetical protein
MNPTSCHPHFELNLHTGPGQSDHVNLDSADEPSYWLLLNIAMGRELGRYLHGLPTAEIFGEILRPWVFEAPHRLDQSGSLLYDT